MSGREPEVRIASEREAGVGCPHCARAIAGGQTVVQCPQCGALNHAECWYGHDGCGSFDCAPPRRALDPHAQPAIKITPADLDRAVPLARPRPLAAAAVMPPPQPQRLQTSRLAVAAFIVALAGIVLFGAVTGLVAIVLGALALGSIHQYRQRGTGLAVTAVLLGIVDVVGWMVFIWAVLARHEPKLTVADFEPDMSVLENVPPPINRAMRANVVIETRHGWGGLGAVGVGSGVIVHIADGQATVVTNRHVVDAGFRGQEDAAGDLPRVDHLAVKLIGQPALPGQVVWVAPQGIDLAVLRVPVYSGEAGTAVWERRPKLAPGDEVFSIGNPQGLTWSHTRGTISQIRRQRRGGRQISVIQTDTPINPGNSGGGLYDERGRLIGINTWTNDKRFSEGLSFAISFQSLLDLNPPFPPQPQADPGPEER